MDEEGKWKAERQTSVVPDYKLYAEAIRQWIAEVDGYLLRHHRKDLSAQWERHEGDLLSMFDPRAPSWQMLDQTVEAGLDTLEGWFRNEKFSLDGSD